MLWGSTDKSKLKKLTSRQKQIVTVIMNHKALNTDNKKKVLGRQTKYSPFTHTYFSYWSK